MQFTPILRSIWLFPLALGGVAGGPHESTGISFVVERVLWFLHQDVVSTLRSERGAIVDAVYPDGAFLTL